MSIESDPILPLQFSYTSQRVLLRAHTISDYPIWKETFLNLPKTDNHWAIQPLAEEELTRKIFRKQIDAQAQAWRRDHAYSFAAFDRNSHQLIGQISLMDVSRAIFQNAYVGYTVHPPYWRKGYGKEMLQSAIDIAFQHLKLHRIEAGIAPENKASIRLAETVGLRFEGLSKKRLFHNEKWCDMRLYAITIEDLGMGQVVPQI